MHPEKFVDAFFMPLGDIGAENFLPLCQMNVPIE